MNRREFIKAGALLPDAAPHSAAWLQAVLDALCDLSSKDALTGLVNRRSFEMSLAREVDRVARAGEPALLLMLDIDHFKAVNDTHGHLAGDQVIRAVASAVEQTVRPMDLVARVGGEEFAIILPNCATHVGLAVAERVRERVSEIGIEVVPGQMLSVTVSLGGAFAPQWVRSSPLLWTERTDRQLYRAKAEGRNRVCVRACDVPDDDVLHCGTTVLRRGYTLRALPSKIFAFSLALSVATWSIYRLVSS